LFKDVLPFPEGNSEETTAQGETASR